MKSWAFVLGAVGAAAAAVVIVTLAMRKAARTPEQQEIPTLLEDCRDRMQRIEQELYHLRSAAHPTT